MNDPDAAKDILQDTFFSALRSLPAFRKESTEKTWMYSILKNKITDHFRRKKEHQSIEQNVVPDNYFFEEDGHWSEHRPHSWEMKTDSLTDSSEFLDVLGECKKKLSEIQQAVFTLKIQEDQDPALICKELGISASNYWVILHRARLQLRECLEKNWINL